MDKQLKTLADKLGSVPALQSDPYEDNLAIALCTYFEGHTQQPEGDPIDDELGWGEWVIEQSNQTMMALAKAAQGNDQQAKRITELEKERDQLKAQNAELSNYGLQLVDTIEDTEMNPNRRALKAGFLVNRVRDGANKYPAACLADIQAKALEGFSTDLEELQRLNNSHDGPIDMHDAIVVLINKATPTGTSVQIVDEQDVAE